MTVLLLILVAIVIGVAYDNVRAERLRRLRAERELQNTRLGYQQFLESYQADAKPAQRKLLLRMLDDLRTGRNGQFTETGAHETKPYDRMASGLPMYPGASHQSPEQVYAPTHRVGLEAVQPVKRRELDGESVLLYFGAFLFVASAGLFVWLGGAPGILKSLTVLVVTAVLYLGGIWLYGHRQKLRPAGQALSGIGIVIAPLIGVSIYNYVLNQQYGYALWLVTSAACLCLYLHAFRIFKSTLMAYLLIMTTLSLFESAIGVAGLPVYVYGWGLAIVAIGLQLAAYFKVLSSQVLIQNSGLNSAKYFLPGALVVALAVTPSLGVVQLGLSLLLAAAYYGVSFLRASGVYRQADALAAQVALTLGISLYVYGMVEDASYGLVAALAVLLLQTGVLVTKGHAGQLWKQFAYVLVAAAVFTVLLSLGLPMFALAAALTAVVIGAAIWWKLQLPAGYGLAGLSLAALPFIYVQLVASQATAELQTILSLAALVILALYHICYFGRTYVADWRAASAIAIGTSIAATMLSALFTGSYFCLLIGSLVTGVMLALAICEESSNWVEPIVAVAALSVFRSMVDETAFPVAVTSMLLLLSLITLRFRSSVLRWACSVLWLLMPWALGNSDLLGVWHGPAYAWAYLAVGVVLMTLRGVALGRVFTSDRVRVVSMLRGASLSYVAGYLLAGVLAVLIAAFSAGSQLHLTLILCVIIVLTLVLARYIERRHEVYAVLPFVAQLALMSGLAPKTGSEISTVYVLLSSALAAGMFFASQAYDRRSPGLQLGKPSLTTMLSLLSGAFAPGAVLVADATWPMALGLVIFGIMMFEYASNKDQVGRELSLGVMVFGLGWLLFIGGVREVQVYAHIAVALFAGLAFWRHQRNEAEETETYLWLTLLSATLPLALQALFSGDQGGLYGWWLLLEQIAIMIVGIIIGKSLLVRWGLYVAVASVLYELRGLGYAALAFLALFLIGLAVYRLQKSGNNKDLSVTGSKYGPKNDNHNKGNGKDNRTR